MKRNAATVENSAVIGHEQNLELLSRAFSRGRLAHAYLFVGPAQVGKMAAARRIAELVLGPGTPLDRHPDFRVVERGRDPKTDKLRADIVLDQVHALRGWLALGALAGEWKVVIIDGAELLNKEAGNALLKSLEEPKDRTLIILLAVSAEAVAPTVRSRCQLAVFGRVPAEAIAGHLRGLGCETGRAELLARLAAGSPGKAIEFWREPAALDALLERRERLLRLASAGAAERWRLLESLVPERLPFNEAAAEGHKVLDLLTEILRDVLLVASGQEQKIVHADALEALAAWSGSLQTAGAVRALEAAVAARRQIDENIGLRGVWGSLALSFDLA